MEKNLIQKIIMGNLQWVGRGLVSHTMKLQFCCLLLSAHSFVPSHAQTVGSQTAERTMQTASEDSLVEMRQQIDSIDTQLIDLLARRMQVCLAVGEYKKRHSIAVVQKDRYNEILEKRSSQGVDKGLDSTFVKNIMNLIHDESVSRQTELLRNRETLPQSQKQRHSRN